jgi:hypothetical protein
MCGNPFFLGETFQLTDEEMAAIGPEAQREVHYCTGCLKSSRHLQHGANILSGIFERKLRAAGVAGAEEIAKRFKQNLLEAAVRKAQ